MKQVIVITEGGSELGSQTAYELAKAGHIVYVCMRDIKGCNASKAKTLKKFAGKNKVSLRIVELDGSSHESAEEAIERIVNECGRLDVVIHNPGHVIFGPTEAFTPEQLAQLYDTNVLSTQRFNRAALPILRRQGKGFMIWLAGSDLGGGSPPYLGPHFAVKAGMDALAVSYAAELARWNIETSIIVPGSLISGVNDCVRPESPEDRARLQEYTSGPTASLARQIMKAFKWSAPTHAGASQIAESIVTIVAMPFGTRPLRLNLDPAQKKAEIVNGVGVRTRADMLQNIGLGDLLSPSSSRVVDIYS